MYTIYAYGICIWYRCVCVYGCLYQDDIEGPNLELLTKPSRHIKPIGSEKVLNIPQFMQFSKVVAI